jgi:hypothetical protein
MCLAPKPARTTERCKIKRVNPAVRSVSTPHWTKDLPSVSPVNPATALGTASEPASASEWGAASLTERLRIELTPRAWKRLVSATASHQTSVEQLLRSCLSEVA